METLTDRAAALIQQVRDQEREEILALLQEVRGRFAYGSRPRVRKRQCEALNYAIHEVRVRGKVS